MTGRSDLEFAIAESRADPGPVADEGRAGGAILLDALAFVIPATMFAEFSIVGRLFLSEILLLGMLPILLLLKGRLLFSRMPMIFFALGLAWLASQIATDLIRGTPFVDWSRGWAKIGMTLVNFAALYLFMHGSRGRIVAFTAGLGVGYLLSYILNPTVYMVADPWKFGVGIGVAHLVAVAVQIRLVREVWMLPGAILSATGLLSLYLGTRSLAGMCIIAGVYLTLYQFLRARSALGARSNVRAFVVAVFVILASLAASQAYVVAAGEGHLGIDAEEKYRQQTGTGLGFFFGGRTEILVSAVAIQDSPIIGHGSWAKNPYYASLLLQYRPELTTTYESGLIPTHSFLFGAWVEAGVVGAIFWLWIWILNGRALLRVFTIREPLVPLFGMVGIVMAWDIIFSPYGAERRFVVPFYVVTAMFLLQMVEYWHGAGMAAARAAARPMTGGRPPAT